MVGKKVLCVDATPGSSLIIGEKYTITEIFRDHDEDYWCVKEINDGNNAFYTRRFIPFIEKLNVNTKVL